MPTTDFDVDLKEHKDSSIATLNVCLGYDNFTGGNLGISYFLIPDTVKDLLFICFLCAQSS